MFVVLALLLNITHVACIQLNIFACPTHSLTQPTYPETFVRGSVIALSLYFSLTKGLPCNSVTLYCVSTTIITVKSNSIDTALCMIFCEELWNGRRFRQHRNRRIWFCKMGNAQTAAHWSHGPEASQWPGCHSPRHLCRITHWRHCHTGRCSGEPGSGQKNC